ncbi:hypothetical protein [Piscinibacter terrae]|nr:hypothetical protein [Albitalea terrae]
MANDIQPAFPFPVPRMNSMTAAEAAKWYRVTVPQIAAVLEGRPHYETAFDHAWDLKSRLRLVAALALYDQELVGEFLAAFPLPLKAVLLGQPDMDALMNLPDGEYVMPVPVPEDEALARLLVISPTESRAFPGTVGEAIGLELWDGRQSWVMTEEGWAPKPADGTGGGDA